MLEQRRGLQIFLVLARKAAAVGGAHFTRKARVFAIGFFVSAPARVALHIDGGSEKLQRGRSFFHIVRDARFVACHVSKLLHEGIVEHGRHAPRLRQNGGLALLVTVYDAARDLGADVRLFNAEARNIIELRRDHADLFFAR